ncbi:WD40-repeat-containing domain protein [Pestalotiopsis sp. NC0098]|nr:WD40-repeat-containing domain protein [Pestalotiopsis sp. NC0098]
MRFRNERQSRLLWISGDPGKGKTMLLCSIIDELESDGSNCISYHFCEASSDILSSAVSVLRGLIWKLVEQEPLLVKYVRKKYDASGKALFSDGNAWNALKEIATAIFQDPAVEGATIIIDALDECTSNRDSLLEFIVSSSKVRWIVSSRHHYTDIEKRFKQAKHMARLTLEDNRDAVDQAVRAYIKHKVDHLDLLREFGTKTRDDVSRYLTDNAQGTFLWVALVCSELAKEEVTREAHVMAKLKSFPRELDKLYQRMLQKISTSMDAAICYGILSLTSTVYRPVTLDELGGFVHFIDDRSQAGTRIKNTELEKIIDSSGSFLDVSPKDGTVSFVHKSARDFLLQTPSEHILGSGIAHQHYKIFSWSLEILHTTLKRDICDLQDPGYILDNSPTPTSDRLASIRYSVLFWADHLEASGCMGESGQVHDKSVSVDLLLRFLNENYLQWLEALSLMRKIPEGTKAIKKLEMFSTTNNSQLLRDLVQDARRFLLSQKQNIESAPLQVYTSALVFSPKNSLIRNLYNHEYNSWIKSEPEVPTNWEACLSTIEETGSIEYNSVTFSNNGLIAYSFDSGGVRILDSDGNRLQTFPGLGRPAFSNNGRIAAANSKFDIEIREVSSSSLLQTLQGHEDPVVSLAFSPEGLVASGSINGTIKIWNSVSGNCLHTLTDHDYLVWDIAISADGQRIASSHKETSTITIWDASGNCLQTLAAGGSKSSLAYSTDNRLAAASSIFGKVQVWDASGRYLQTLETSGSESSVGSIAFSLDGQRVAGTTGRTLKVWDTTLGGTAQTPEHDRGMIRSFAFSADGRKIATSSSNGIIKLWDNSGKCIQTLLAGFYLHSFALSTDGQRIAVISGSSLHIWDTTSGIRLCVLEDSKDSRSIAFSPDGRRVVTGFCGKPYGLQVWDTTSGDLTRIASDVDPETEVQAVAFSSDGRYIVSGSGKTVNIWEVASGNCIQTLKVDHEVISLAFSSDGQRVIARCLRLFLGMSPSYTEQQRAAIAAGDKSFSLWDCTQDCLWITLSGRPVLWLPPEYRPYSGRYAVCGSTVAIGSISGAVHILRFADHDSSLVSTS